MNFIQLGISKNLLHELYQVLNIVLPFNLYINRLPLSLRDNSCILYIVSLFSPLVISSPSMASATITQPQDGPQTHASWLNLPPEMRFEILDLVSQDDRDPRHTWCTKPDRLSPYATVCSEWQTFFEKVTFRHLLVDNTALEDFGRIMSGKNTDRTSNLRHMLFVIVLPGYSCPSCHKLESWFDIYQYVPSSNIFHLYDDMLMHHFE